MSQRNAQKRDSFSHSNNVRYNPPDHNGGLYGGLGVEALYQRSVFSPTDNKYDTFPQGFSNSYAAASDPSTSANSYDTTRHVEKPLPILIEPHKAEHSHSNQWLIEALHLTLKRIVESWSGETREDQEKVLNKMVKELDKGSQNIIRDFAHGAITVDVEALRRILDGLCGPEGKLCLVNRGGTQSGVSSIVCNKCQKSFDSNPVQAYAHHLITLHWQTKAFACYASGCEKRFAWTHDRDRHERSKHGLYRRKAYDLAMKQEAEEAAQTPAPRETPRALTDAERLYQAFRGYNEWTNSWE